jgi:hypothetical protein
MVREWKIRLKILLLPSYLDTRSEKSHNTYLLTLETELRERLLCTLSEALLTLQRYNTFPLDTRKTMKFILLKIAVL